MQRKSNVKPYDYLIVGSGLFGSTMAYRLNKLGFRVAVIEKRNHVGGNIYCEEIDDINVHKYGAHIFHTSDKEVWDFVNLIVPFNRYTNSPLAKAPNGKLYNLPFNMNTFYQMWGVETPEQALAKLDEQRANALAILGDREPANLEEQAIVLIGQDIYELLIKGYTEKQWGRKCTELPTFIIRRLPVRMTFDNNYFNDSFQGVPIGGYNKLIDGLLAGVDVRLCEDFFDNRKYWESLADRIVFTGKIDQYFDYRFGALEYRTLRFETEILDTPNWQGNAIVNFTAADVPFTRIIEHKHFEMSGPSVYANPKTVISREYSIEWHDGMEPYYPVNNARNQKIYEQYKALAEKHPNIIFGGRLAEYKYYDMAPIIRNALDIKL